jgi:hypothetical protein
MENCYTNCMKSKFRHNPPRRTRPYGVLILAFFSFSIAAWHGLRLGTDIFFWKTLVVYGANPLYITLSAVAWLVIGLFVFWSVWQGKAWGWMASLVFTASYTFWYWFDRLFLQKPHSNWPFSLSVTIIMVTLVVIILFTRTTRKFFHREDYERKPENPTIA